MNYSNYLKLSHFGYCYTSLDFLYNHFGLLYKKENPLIRIKWYHSTNEFADIDSMATFIDSRYTTSPRQNLSSKNDSCEILPTHF